MHNGASSSMPAFLSARSFRQLFRIALEAAIVRGAFWWPLAIPSISALPCDDTPHAPIAHWRHARPNCPIGRCPLLLLSTTSALSLH